MRIELISWRDACDVGGDLSRQRTKKLPLVHTIGVVEYETQDAVILKHHWAEQSSDEFETDISDEGIAIPKAWIVKRMLVKK